MKNILLLLLPALLIWGFTQMEEKPQPTEKTMEDTQPINEMSPFAILELFTSQGCSSCPPADEQLARFAARSADGEEIYTLSYHVDYWNYLGWEDPFSDARFSERQRNYAARLNSRVYTPQLVVNGRSEMIGSRQRETEVAVSRALKIKPAHALAFTSERVGEKVTINYQISGGALPEDAQLVAVAAQRSANLAVKRGENRGRELQHVNVVRAFAQRAVKTANGTITLELPADLGEHDIVVFLQDGEAGLVLAAKK